MAVAAKFFVASITRNSYNRTAAEVKLSVVCRGDENKEWAAATPSGSATLTIGNPAAVEMFQSAFDANQEIVARFELA